MALDPHDFQEHYPDEISNCELLSHLLLVVGFILLCIALVLWSPFD